MSCDLCILIHSADDATIDVKAVGDAKVLDEESPDEAAPRPNAAQAMRTSGARVWKAMTHGLDYDIHTVSFRVGAHSSFVCVFVFQCPCTVRLRPPPHTHTQNATTAHTHTHAHGNRRHMHRWSRPTHAWRRSTLTRNCLTTRRRRLSSTCRWVGRGGCGSTTSLARSLERVCLRSV